MRKAPAKPARPHANTAGPAAKTKRVPPPAAPAPAPAMQATEVAPPPAERQSRQGPEGGPKEKKGWFLGFDCATKTFAYSLSWVDLTAGGEIRRQLDAAKELLRRAEAFNRADNIVEARKAATAAAEAVQSVDARSRFIRIVAGGVKDLFPGRADKEISTVERIRGVKAYIETNVIPAIAADIPDGSPPRVVVEFQMGPNAPSRVVAAALITLFADYDVFIVGPSLKNKVAIGEKGRYCYFAEKYKTNYTSNKAHARYNFEQIEKVFGTGIPPTSPPALRGHIADSFMQILGHLMYGDDENASVHF